MKTYTGLDDPQLAESLRSGAVGILPTDTVYGLVCSARDLTAVERLYALKQREAKPGTVIAADIRQLVELGLKERYLKAVAHYWPNPISIVIPCHDLQYIHQGVGSIAVRIPKDAKVASLLDAVGPLVTSSANQPGEAEAEDISEAQAHFGETVDFYVDGGNKSQSQASTVIRIVDDAVEILREGLIKIDEAGRIIP